MLLILGGLFEQLVYVMLVIKDRSLGRGPIEATVPPKLLLIFFMLVNLF
jgi:hypothetical protein